MPRKLLPLLLVATVALAGCGGGETAAPPSAPADPAHEAPAEVRTVLVTRSMPAPSEPGDVVHAMLELGTMPAAEQLATVLTDEECIPDAEGISHCRNEVRLEDGLKLILRHPHDMSVVPCLVPGEIVRIAPA